MSDQDQQIAVMNRFISLANDIKDEGVPVHVVSWAMMTASAVYATYSVAGNTGGLNPSGVDKVVDSYRDCMNQVQEARKNELKEAGAEIENEQA
jgi:hypothetical protein